MRVLVHICCGPCAISVLQWLRETGHEVVGFFFNPNIQPLAEYLRRREGAREVCEKLGFPLLLADTLPWEEQVWSSALTACLPQNPAIVGAEPLSGALHADSNLDCLPPAVHPVEWLRFMNLNEFDRCKLCWSLRLKKTAWVAEKYGYEAISSSLLYSRYQNHEVIKGQGETVAAAAGVQFVYHDFRRFWNQGIQKSKELGIFRQQYCGCIFSEYARYAKTFTSSRLTEAE